MVNFEAPESLNDADGISKRAHLMSDAPRSSTLFKIEDVVKNCSSSFLTKNPTIIL